MANSTFDFDLRDFIRYLLILILQLCHPWILQMLQVFEFLAPYTFVIVKSKSTFIHKLYL